MCCFRKLPWYETANIEKLIVFQDIIQLWLVQTILKVGSAESAPLIRAYRKLL